MNQLLAETRKWLDETRKPKKREAKASQTIEQTRIAYDARRDPNLRSGEYDFAFRSKPPAVPILSVSEFEQLVSAPALIWLKKYLGVKAAEENGNVWNTFERKWVHDWLAAMAGGTERTFTRSPASAEIEERIARGRSETLGSDAALPGRGQTGA